MRSKALTNVSINAMKLPRPNVSALGVRREMARVMKKGESCDLYLPPPYTNTHHTHTYLRDVLVISASASAMKPDTPIWLLPGL
jgi:hypothetical protein